MFKALEIPFSFTLLHSPTLSCSFWDMALASCFTFSWLRHFLALIALSVAFWAFTWFALVRFAFSWLGLALLSAALVGVVVFCLHISHSTLSSLDEPQRLYWSIDHRAVWECGSARGFLVIRSISTQFTSSFYFLHLLALLAM